MFSLNENCHVTIGGRGVGGFEPVSTNDTLGECGSKIGQKKCHILFEWPLTTIFLWFQRVRYILVRL